MKYQKWTTAQEQLIRDHAGEGIDAVCAYLYQAGTPRSTSAVRSHAARMGVSLRVRFTCPACGHIGGPGDFRFGDGLCEACHVKRKAEALDRKNEILEREYRQRLKQAERENARMRKRTQRIRDRYKGREG